MAEFKPFTRCSELSFTPLQNKKQAIVCQGTADIYEMMKTMPELKVVNGADIFLNSPHRNDDRVQVSEVSASVDPSPVSDPYGKEYKLIEKSIRQTWELPGLMVSPYLVIGGSDSKYFAASIAKNVYRFTAVRVESAADAARWHGVKERVLVDEYANSIRFFHNFIGNAEEV